MTKPENPPAFPSSEEHPSYDIPMHHFGMSLRDWFAGQALASTMRLVTGYESEPGEGMAQTFARRAYELADAMLAERKRHD